MLNHTQFLGYTKGPDGVLQIVPEEAEIVRKIFDLYIQGNGVRKIKRYLEEHGISTRQGTHAVHTLGYYRDKYGYRPEDLPGAYACDRLSLALPLYVELSDDDQDYVIEQIEKGEKAVR